MSNPSDMSDAPRFTIGAFLRDKMLTLVFTCAVVLFISFMLVVLGTVVDAVVLIGLTLVIAVVLALAVEYRRRVRFWKSVTDATEALDRTKHFADLVHEPTFVEGMIALETVRAIAEQAARENGELETQSYDRAQYTELWVHEVKTPLAAARLLLDKMHGEDAGKLKLELERVENLVEQALFTARSDTLVNDYLIREIALASAVGEACKANMRYLTSCGVSVDIRIDPQVTVVADKTWLAFILTQIIVNAAKYDATTIVFESREEGAEGPHACTTLEMRDDGCGIPAADVPRVFDRGFTGEVGRAHGSATGMGLFLVARMCTQMGLGIMLASEEGTGTRVQISFPHDRRRMHMSL